MRITPAVLILAGLLLAAHGAAAFTFADGTNMACVVDGAEVPEIVPPPGDPFYKVPRTGLVTREGGTPRILWNAQRLAILPPEIRDFIFFHECAHARVPTEDELTANCAGLVDMRAAGRAGREFERRLRAYFPADNAYWNETFLCADRGLPVAPDSPAPAR
jgi:hypothetical protein